jgi:hypothetical protein
MLTDYSKALSKAREEYYHYLRSLSNEDYSSTEKGGVVIVVPFNSGLGTYLRNEEHLDPWHQNKSGDRFFRFSIDEVVKFNLPLARKAGDLFLKSLKENLVLDACLEEYHLQD